MVATPADLEEVVLGADGLLGASSHPRVVVSCSTVDVATSARVRAALATRGVWLPGRPISGNPHVVAAGGATHLASGPRATYDLVAPLLDTVARASVWVGEAEEANTVKICHNLYLGLIVQSIAEVTILAEKSGVDRAVFLDFLNSTGLATPLGRAAHPRPALARLDADLHDRALAQGLRTRHGQRPRGRGADAPRLERPATPPGRHRPRLSRRGLPLAVRGPGGLGGPRPAAPED